MRAGSMKYSTAYPTRAMACVALRVQETGRKEGVGPDHNHQISAVLFGKGFSIKRAFILVNAKLRSLKSFYNLDSL